MANVLSLVMSVYKYSPLDAAAAVDDDDDEKRTAWGCESRIDS
jgi:hypothetical protein